MRTPADSPFFFFGEVSVTSLSIWSCGWLNRRVIWSVLVTCLCMCVSNRYWILKLWFCDRGILICRIWRSFRFGNFPSFLERYIVSVFDSNSIVFHFLNIRNMVTWAVWTFRLLCASFKFGVTIISSAYGADAESTSTFWLCVAVALTTTANHWVWNVGFKFYVQIAEFQVCWKSSNLQRCMHVSMFSVIFVILFQRWFHLLKYLPDLGNEWLLPRPPLPEMFKDLFG